MSVIRKQGDSLAESYVSTLFQFDEVVIRGPDAVQFISNFTTADIHGLQEHEGCDGFFCDARGWVLEMAVLLRSDNGLLIRVARGDGAGGGDEGESSCEDVQRMRLMMRCRRGARSRGAIRVPGRSRPGGVRPRQSYTSRMGFPFGIRRATAAAAVRAGRGERR